MVAVLFRPDELVVSRVDREIRLTFRRDDGEEQRVVLDRGALARLILGSSASAKRCSAGLSIE